MALTASGFQAALAHVLASRDARTALADRPQELRDRFGLTSDELTILTRADAARLELNAQTVSAKRLDFLKRALPATSSFFAGQCHDHRLVRFTEACPPIDLPEHPNRLIAEAHRFAEYLQEGRLEGAPPHLADLARLELMRLELVLSAEASHWAERTFQQQRTGGGRIELSAHTRLRLGRHVALGRFDFELLSLTERARRGVDTTKVQRRPTFVALRKAHPRGSIVSYRIGQSVHGMLLLWSTPRSLTEMHAATAGNADSGDRSRTEAAARFALTEGLLVAC